MGERRVNPDTGIIEENTGFFFDDWQPAKNDNDRVERVDPETGVVQEDHSTFGGAFGHDWESKDNEHDRAERVNPDTGRVEEDHSVFDGAFGSDWQPKANDENRQERLNPDTGVVEEDISTFQGTFGSDWQPKSRDGGPAERVNPRTGVVEKDHSVFGGAFGRDWRRNPSAAEEDKPRQYLKTKSGLPSSASSVGSSLGGHGRASPNASSQPWVDASGGTWVIWLIGLAVAGLLLKQCSETQSRMQTAPSAGFAAGSNTASPAAAPRSQHFESTGVLGYSFAIRLYNCDDACVASVDGREIASVGFGEDSGILDISDNIGTWVDGRSSRLVMQTINKTGAVTYGFELWVNGQLADRKECGVVFRVGCDDNEPYVVGPAVTWSIVLGRTGSSTTEPPRTSGAHSTVQPQFQPTYPPARPDVIKPHDSVPSDPTSPATAPPLPAPLMIAEAQLWLTNLPKTTARLSNPSSGQLTITFNGPKDLNGLEAALMWDGHVYRGTTFRAGCADGPFTLQSIGTMLVGDVERPRCGSGPGARQGIVLRPPETPQR